MKMKGGEMSQRRTRRSDEKAPKAEKEGEKPRTLNDDGRTVTEVQVGVRHGDDSGKWIRLRLLFKSGRADS